MSDQHNSRRLWPFAPLYDHILREGHQKQAPACGSPTLIWHMALWPHESLGERKHSLPGRDSEPNERARAHFSAYDEDNVAFFDELSHFAMALQQRGRVGDARPLKLRQAVIDIPDGAIGETFRFQVCDPQALTFTLWWQDKAKGGIANQRQDNPQRTDLRVQVQLQTHRDHATIAFYIDVGKMHDGTQFMTSQDVFNLGGERRPKILRYIDKIRETSAKQIRGGYVDMNRIPERGVEAADAEQLLAAANYCYDEIWQEFAQAFGLDGMLDVRGEKYPHIRRADRFADFRGLVMSVRGIESPQKAKRRAARNDLRNANAVELDNAVKDYTTQEDMRDIFTPSPISGTIGFGQLSRFEKDANEGNTVLKSLWPFMRRMTPWADYSDWVGCGIIGGRALYITALGSEAMVRSASDEYALRETEVPNGSLPAAEINPPNHPRALRYMVVTKGEPLREQVGRFVERINAIGTMRLFALRSMPDIRNASIQIEVLGRMLDGTLRTWEAERKKIDDEFTKACEAHQRKKPDDRLLEAYTKGEKERKITPRLLRINAAHTAKLNELVNRSEREVIGVSSRLDDLGAGGYGRLLYAIRRASYFAEEFDRMWQTLGVEDVEGWINYKNFVQRGMQPAFALIKSTGDRLVSLRERLQTMSETIQTAALIAETRATSDNTAQLRRIATAIYLARPAAWVVVSVWVYQLFLHDYIQPKFNAWLHAKFDPTCSAIMEQIGGEPCVADDSRSADQNRARRTRQTGATDALNEP